MKKKMYVFHGGCHGCTQQERNGVEFCVGCQFFDTDWGLPNLNNRPPSREDIKRAELKRAALKAASR